MNADCNAEAADSARVTALLIDRKPARSETARNNTLHEPEVEQRKRSTNRTHRPVEHRAYSSGCIESARKEQRTSAFEKASSVHERGYGPAPHQHRLKSE